MTTNPAPTLPPAVEEALRKYEQYAELEAEDPIVWPQMRMYMQDLRAALTRMAKEHAAELGEQQVAYSVQEKELSDAAYLAGVERGKEHAAAELTHAWASADMRFKAWQKVTAELAEARAERDRWIKAALYATPITTDCFSPDNPEAFGESRRHAVDQLAARAEAAEAEARRLREALEGAVVTMEAWADALDMSPESNDNYCEAVDVLADVWAKHPGGAEGEANP